MVAPPLYMATTTRKLMVVVVVMVAAALQLTEAFFAPLVVHKKGPSASSLKRPAGGAALPSFSTSSSSLTLLTSLSRKGFGGALRRQAEEGEGGEDGGAPAMESNAADDSTSGGGGATTRSRKIATGKRKRVRKDRPSNTAEETKEPKPADPREQARQESIITREFDRAIVMEEFAQDQIIDRTKLMPSELERYDGLKQRPEGEGVPDNLKYDPTFELPIPSETVLSLSDIATKFDGAIEAEEKALPTLAELGKKAKGSILKRQLEEEEKANKELEPIDDYDLSSGILGEGRPVFGIGLPYLQSCHTVIILVTLLCAFVEFPGFPLTNLPYEMREFLKQGLVVVYLINAVLAYNSIGESKKRNQSVFFWGLKCFVLGALAHNELLLIRVKNKASI